MGYSKDEVNARQQIHDGDEGDALRTAAHIHGEKTLQQVLPTGQTSGWWTGSTVGPC